MKEYLSYLEDAKMGISGGAMSLRSLSKQERMHANTVIYHSLYMKLKAGKDTKELGTAFENILEKYFMVDGEELTNTNLPPKVLTGFFDLRNQTGTKFFSVKLNHPFKPWNKWIDGNFTKSKKWLVNNTIQNPYFKQFDFKGHSANFYLLRGYFENEAEDGSIIFVLELSNPVSGRKILNTINADKSPDTDRAAVKIITSLWQPRQIRFKLSGELEKNEIMEVKEQIKNEIIKKTFVSPKSFVHKLENITEKAKDKLS